MTFLSIQNTVKSRIARTNIETTDQVKTWINERQRLICTHKNWWFMRKSATFNTVALTQSYDLPTDFKDDFVIYSTIDNVTKIIPMISIVDALKYYNTGDKGSPEHFVLQNGNILFYPIPDKVYAMTNLYYGYLVDLSLDADINTITNELPEILIAGALSEGFTYLQESNDAAQWEAKYQGYIRELNARDIQKRLPAELVLIPRTDVYASGLDIKVPKVLEDWW